MGGLSVADMDSSYLLSKSFRASWHFPSPGTLITKGLFVRNKFAQIGNSLQTAYFVILFQRFPMFTLSKEQIAQAHHPKEFEPFVISN